MAHASCRADLAGGTLDLWPLYLFHPGAVTVNFALSIHTSCRIEPRPGRAIHLRSLDTGREDRFANLPELCRAPGGRHAIGMHLVRHFAPQEGFLLETDSQSPAGAGISGSSALMIATVAALARFTGRKLAREEMRVIAQNVEAQIIRIPTGCQDYYPALYGGVSAIHLGVEGIRREALPVAPAEINQRFLLVYTGAPRESGINNWEVFKRHMNGDKLVVRNFDLISAIASAMRAALLKSDWDDVARLLREEWKLRRRNHPGISTPLIERLISIARRNGGVAAKVCGAGGGGCLILMTDAESKPRLAESLAAAGGRVLPFEVAKRGVSAH
jgi:D-glycero-alpha-D-manno-heptose-7-phosphate kinase